jgi:hypothetical protein
MAHALTRSATLALSLLAGVACLGRPAQAEGDWEITPESQEALQRGLQWLERTQGPEGNWESNDLGLVSTGALAFLAAGELPGRGRHGDAAARALDYVLENAQPSGLLNIAEERRGMYNHGLSTFVLGQAYGVTDDPRIGPVLDRALKLICQTQAQDGGWDYVARRQSRGHDLSLAVMQALALRSAVDSGLEVPPEVVDLAIRSVRKHYTPKGCAPNAPEDVQRGYPGQFTYTPGQNDNATVAMAAAGVVCLQEFGQYGDWRIEKSMQVVTEAIEKDATDEKSRRQARGAFGDAYTVYYAGQALYQVGGEHWRRVYPLMRDKLVDCQVRDPARPDRDGMWPCSSRVSGRPGELYMTAVACFILAIPNRYLPILQEGQIDSLRTRFGSKQGQ